MVLEAQGATCNGLPYTPPRGVDLLGMDSLTWRPVEGRKRLGTVISHYRVEERLGGRFDQPRPSRKPQSATSVQQITGSRSLMRVWEIGHPRRP